jgi:hypothetical protein
LRKQRINDKKNQAEKGGLFQVAVINNYWGNRVKYENGFAMQIMNFS